VATGKVISIH